MYGIKLGVLGAGYWGKKLCKEYSTIEASTKDVFLTWVADVSNSALESTKMELVNKQNDTTTNFTTDYGVVLQDDQVDAVDIALPNHLHYEAAIAALESGKHVLLEKPIATTSREAFELVRLSEEKGLVLQGGHIFRFNNAVRTVKEILRQNRLGRLFYLNLVWSTFMAPPKDTDIVFDLACHPIDILNYLLDGWPMNIDAMGGSYYSKKANAEEMAFINLEFPGDILAHVYISWIQYGTKERSIRLINEKGTLYCDALNQKIVLNEPERNAFQVPLLPFTLSRSPEARDGNTLSVDPWDTSLDTESAPNNTIRDMQYHFLDTIKRGGSGPQVNDALIGAQTVKVLEDITYAMRMRKGLQAQTRKEFDPKI